MSTSEDTESSYTLLKDLLADPVLIYQDEVGLRLNRLTGARQSSRIQKIRECWELLESVSTCILGFLRPIVDAIEPGSANLAELGRVPDMLSWCLIFAAGILELFNSIQKMLGEESGSASAWDQLTPVEEAWTKAEQALLDVVPAIALRMVSAQSPPRPLRLTSCATDSQEIHHGE